MVRLYLFAVICYIFEELPEQIVDFDQNTATFAKMACV
jgi:hypothetical protein